MGDDFCEAALPKIRLTAARIKKLHALVKDVPYQDDPDCADERRDELHEYIDSYLKTVTFEIEVPDGIDQQGARKLVEDAYCNSENGKPSDAKNLTKDEGRDDTFWHVAELDDEDNETGAFEVEWNY